MAGDVVATVYGPMSAKLAKSSLADLCLPNVGIQTGPFGSQLHASDYVEYGTPIITVEHLGENRIIHSNLPRVTDEDKERLSRYKLITGDIVFSRVGSVDRRAIVHPEENDWLLSGRCLRVRPDRKKIDPSFLSWFFGLPTFQEHIRQIAVGATMPSLNTKILGDVTIFYPPSLKEQQAIACILGALDDKIELNRKMNRTLEAMAQAIFKSWFVDFDPVRAKTAGRAPGLPKKIADLFPDCFVDSDLGEIPRGWNVANLGDIAEVIDCLHSKKPERQASGKPLLQLWNIRDDSLIDMTDTYFITEDDYSQWISRMEAIPGDCVITNVGRVAATAQIPIGLNAALGRNMTGIRCRVSFPFPTFLIECLHSSAMMEEIAQKTDTGTILDALNVRNIPKLRIIKPSNNIASQFEVTSRPLRSKMERNFSILIQFTNLRDTLLPKLISGELSLPDAEQIIARCL
ncbi:MAG: restriction endonuclease subunit S [Planctomycetota bacterium]